MNRIVVLDSGPLALILQRPGYSKGADCWQWVEGQIARGVRVIVPEIIEYELRRELIRLQKTKSLTALDVFINGIPDRLLPLRSSALRLAAELWAKARQQGTPTADPHALDVDVILCAQVLTAGLDLNELVIATSNVKHIRQFVNAQEWTSIP